MTALGKIVAAPAGPGLDPAIVVSIAQAEFGVLRSDILSRRRRDDYVEARAFVAWALRSLGRPMSYPAIGRELAGRDHTTIINLHRKAIALRLTRPAFKGACDRLAFRFNAERMLP